MRESALKPSVIRIIQSDYIAILAIVFPIAAWLLYIGTSYFGFVPGMRGRDALTASDASTFLYLSLAVTLVCVPMLFWRVRNIQTMFERGIETPGQVTDINFYRDRGRVEYSYVFEGQTYRGGNALHKSKRAKSLRRGDSVVVVVDSQNPKRAFIRDLYM